MFSVDYWAFVKNRIEFYCIEFRGVILEKRISFITQILLDSRFPLQEKGYSLLYPKAVASDCEAILITESASQERVFTPLPSSLFPLPSSLFPPNKSVLSDENPVPLLPIMCDYGDQFSGLFSSNF